MNKVVQNNILNDLYLLKSIGYEYVNNFSFDKVSSLPNNMIELSDIVDNCNLCVLSNTCKNKIFSYGKENKVVFLIEKAFPNEKEYLFFIDIITSNLEMSKDEIYIVNVLKCDSNININNHKDEVELCKNYMIKQLDILKPTVIVSLGESYKYLLSKYSFTNVVKGDNLFYKGSDLFVMDHPEFILRNPSIKDNVMNQLKKIKNKMEKI